MVPQKNGNNKFFLFLVILLLVAGCTEGDGGDTSSLSDSVVVENHPPVADAGLEQAAFVGDTVLLDSSGSSDADADTLSFQWSFVSVPDGSMTTLSDETAPAPTFIVDQPGTYVAALIVNDGSLDSTPDTVTMLGLPKPNVGSIVVVVHAVPNDGQDFAFTEDISGPTGAFDLDADAGSSVPNTKTFAHVAPGTYTVTETPVSAGWWGLSDLRCIDTNPSGTASTGDTATGVATINLDVNDGVICIFTNTWPTAVVFDGILRCPVAWDDFYRPDVDLHTGDLSPSGHAYVIIGERQHIQDNRYVSQAVPQKASIAYLWVEQRPTVISGEFLFKNLEGVVPREHGVNAVIGVAKQSFGQGSVQLGVWRDGWKLFVVENPIVNPYPVLAQGYFATVLEVDTPYRFAVVWDESTSTALVYAPDGEVVAVTHPYINQYWGTHFGIQKRQSIVNDGTVEFINSAAGTDAENAEFCD